MLQEIFTNTEINQYITFKGGTSLSKCYNMINRFSEDCDLTINKTFLELSNNLESIETKSKNQQKKLIEKLEAAVKNKISEDLKPILSGRFESELSYNFKKSEWDLTIDPAEEKNLLFFYPTCLDAMPNGYVQRVVKLEFGARGDNHPNETKPITPYIYNTLAHVFPKPPSIPVQTLTAARTFWEKITLLHAEYHRPKEKAFQSRMFRHYYDVTMLDKNNVTKQALNNLDLLRTVLKNKKLYFSSSSANYDTAKIGSFKLFPNDFFIDDLKQDCKKMSEMFFGEPPEFDKTMESIKKIERVINKFEC